MFVSVLKLYIQFSQKLLVLSILFFAALTQGRFFHPEFCFLMKLASIAGRNVNKKKFENNISQHFTEEWRERYS